MALVTPERLPADRTNHLYPPTSSYLSNPEIQNKVPQEVAAYLAPTQMEMEAVAEKPDIVWGDAIAKGLKSAFV